MKQGDTYIKHASDRLIKKVWQLDGSIHEFYARTEMGEIMIAGTLEFPVTYFGLIQVVTMTIDNKFSRIIKAQCPPMAVDRKELKDAMVDSLTDQQCAE